MLPLFTNTMVLLSAPDLSIHFASVSVHTDVAHQQINQCIYIYLYNRRIAHMIFSGQHDLKLPAGNSFMTTSCWILKEASDVELDVRWIVLCSPTKKYNKQCCVTFGARKTDLLHGHWHQSMKFRRWCCTVIFTQKFLHHMPPEARNRTLRFIYMQVKAFISKKRTTSNSGDVYLFSKAINLNKRHHCIR